MQVLMTMTPSENDPFNLIININKNHGKADVANHVPPRLKVFHQSAY